MSSKARILVVGDAGVGKTSLVHLLCNGAILEQLQRTVACHMDVKLIDNQSSSDFVLEFLDVAGISRHPKARSIFYKNFQGIIFVYNLKNPMSYQNCWKWVAEVFQVMTEKHVLNQGLTPKVQRGKVFTGDFDVEQFNSPTPVSTPMLIIGTHEEFISRQGINKDCPIAKEYNGVSLKLSTQSKLHSSIEIHIKNFYKKLLDNSYSSSAFSNSSFSDHTNPPSLTLRQLSFN